MHAEKVQRGDRNSVNDSVSCNSTCSWPIFACEW